MKIKQQILKLFISIIILNLIFPNHIIAQKNNSGETAAAAIGALAAIGSAVAAIENYKEILETKAVNYIMKNHPEHTQFRIQLIQGVYESTKKRSDQSEVTVVPFGFTELENGKPTNTQKILFMFTSPGWVNNNGVNLSRVTWEFLTKDDWNNLIRSFANLNSPAQEIGEDFFVPIYKKVKGKQKEDASDILTITNRNDSGKRTYKITSEAVHINDLVIDKYGFSIYGTGDFSQKVIYPFYRLAGDDYLIADFSETMKIFSNEKTLGIFLKKIGETKLMTRNTLNNVHNFMNAIPFGVEQ